MWGKDGHDKCEDMMKENRQIVQETRQIKINKMYHKHGDYR